MRDAVSVTVPRPIYNRIRARLKPYQAMAGVLQELLDLADKFAPLPPQVQKPEEVKPPTSDTINKKEETNETPKM